MRADGGAVDSSCLEVRAAAEGGKLYAPSLAMHAPNCAP